MRSKTLTRIPQVHYPIARYEPRSGWLAPSGVMMPQERGALLLRDYPLLNQLAWPDDLHARLSGTNAAQCGRDGRSGAHRAGEQPDSPRSR